MGDLDIKFRLRLEDLKLEETYVSEVNTFFVIHISGVFFFFFFLLLVNLHSQQHQLGKGGFADVYKASYQNKTVAVKVFSHGMASMSNTTPNQLVRQEVRVYV